MAALVDLRAERSRQAILDAFAEQLFRGGFDTVSVQGIARAAGVARSTFYEHFGNKEDVLRASMARFFAVLAQSFASDDQHPDLYSVLSHFWDNRRLTDAVFAVVPRRILALSLSEMIEAQLRQADDRLLLPHRLAAIQLAEAQLALVENWLKGRAFATAEDVAAALHRSSRASATALTRG